MDQQEVNAILFVGRAPNCWKDCMPTVMERIIRPLEEKTGLQSIYFTSNHCGENDNKETLDQFVSTIEPVMRHTEDHYPYPEHDIYKLHYPQQNEQPRRAVSKFFHNSTVFDLLQYHVWRKRGDTKVRWVLVLRPDLVMHEIWDLPEYPVDRAVYVPKSPRHYNFTGDIPGIPDWTPDQVNAGSFETMRMFCSIYDYIFRDVRLGQTFTPVFVPEYAMNLHLEKQWGIKILGLPCEYDLHHERKI